MNVILLLISAMVINVLGRTTQDLGDLSQDEYTARALAELKALNKSRFLTDLEAPTCKIFKKRNAMECSLKFRWIKQPRVIAIKVSFNLNRAQLKFTLFFDGEEMFNHKVDVAKICVPLPGLLKQLNICAQAYHINVDTKSPGISFDACFVVKISDFFHLRLNCIAMDKNGKFFHHAKYAPEDEGIIMLSIEEGNVKFKLNNPIPKEVMEKIEQGWKNFEKDVKQGVDIAGKELNKVGKDIEKGVNEAGKEVEKGINQAGKELNNVGKDIEKGVNQVGKELNKVGKDIEKGVNQVGQELNKVGKDIEKGWNDAGQTIKDQFSKWFG